MFKIIKESLTITNNNLIIATPLIFFSLISSLYLIFSGNNSIISLSTTIVLFFLMIGAFLAGWFHMVKIAVTDSKLENQDALITEFLSGVGEYFLSVLGLIFNTVIISGIIIIAAIFAGKHFIGNIGISYSDFISASANVESMKNFVTSLTPEQLININKWNLLMFITILVNNFILMFYAPAIFIKKKNPFIALFISIKDIFCRKFFKNIALFIFICITYLLLSVFSTIFGSNIIIHFLITLINFYYATFIVILVFNYYFSNYAKIGSNVDKII